MKTVSQTYDDEVISAFIKKVKQEHISSYTTKIYQEACNKDPDISTIGIVASAAYTSNWNAGKGSLGEKAQLQILKKIFLLL